MTSPRFSGRCERFDPHRASGTQHSLPHPGCGLNLKAKRFCVRCSSDQPLRGGKQRGPLFVCAGCRVKEQTQ